MKNIDGIFFYHHNSKLNSFMKIYYFPKLPGSTGIYLFIGLNILNSLFLLWTKAKQQ